MTLKHEKLNFRFEALPEVFVSNKGIASAVSKAVSAGRLKKIGSRLYVKNLEEPPEAVVRRNWYLLLKDYYPDALIADRTALENQPAADGSVFIISKNIRPVSLPGITFRPRRGTDPLAGDATFLGGVHLSSTPRAWLENMRPSRRRAAEVSRTLSQPELEERLDAMLRQAGEAEVNRLRDQARELSHQLGMAKEFLRLDALIGTFLGTREAQLETVAGRARQSGSPFDPGRVSLFQNLFELLQGRSPVVRTPTHEAGAGRTNLAFFEAYFSNYIEGTEFAVDEALDIVFKGVMPRERPADAHDVLGTYRLVADAAEMATRPRQFSELLDLLQRRHRRIMELRPEKQPGQFKSKPNRAGDTLFVAPDLVRGTLARGFEFYRHMENPFHRAVFMMFLISEVHPFADGNGRVARVMMNAELVAAQEQRIIIPTAFRTDYLTALKALSQTGRSLPLIQVLDFAQRYTGAIRWENLESARADLQSTHAFLAAEEAERRGVRLMMPAATG